MEAATYVTEGVTHNMSDGPTPTVETAAAAAPMCDAGEDPTWHADFTWWTDGIAMLLVGKGKVLYSRGTFH